MDLLEEYDEFGNLIAPPLQHPSGTVSGGLDRDLAQAFQTDVGMDDDDDAELDDLAELDAQPQQLGVPQYGEDEEANPFGDDVEVVVERAPQLEMDQHLVSPAAKASDVPLLIEGRKAKEEVDYLSFLQQTPIRHRNVALVGHLHHGKTSLMRGLLGTKELLPQRSDEVKRKISLKANVVSGVVRGKSRHGAASLLTVIDTPGHPDFQDEVAASLRLVDCAVLCLDVAEGLHPHVERLVQMVVKEKLKIVLVLTKIDRLVLELRISPKDAQAKMKFLVDSVNNMIVAAGGGQGSHTPIVHPPEGTVLFSSEKVGLLFSLATFAESQYSGFGVDAEDLAQYLWGRVHFDGLEFQANTKETGKPDSFVSFVMEPIYKVLLHSIAGQAHKAIHPDLNPMPTSGEEAMKDAVWQVFGDRTAHGVDCLFTEGVVPLSSERSAQLAQMYELAPTESFAAVTSLMRVVGSGEELVAVARVIKGPTPAAGVKLEVEVTNAAISIHQSSIDTVSVRTTTGLLKLKQAYAGSIVQLSGSVVEAVEKHAVILPITFGERRAPTMIPLHLPTPMIRVALEPHAPETNIIIQQGLNKISKTYPGCQVFLNEASSEPVVVGYGELYLDVLMHDLRLVYCNPKTLRLAAANAAANAMTAGGDGTTAAANIKNIRVKLSTPFVAFQESVEEVKGPLVMEPPEAPKGALQICMTASAMDPKLTEWCAEGLVRDLEKQRQEISAAAGSSSVSSAPVVVDMRDSKTKQLVEGKLRTDFGWDIVAAKNVWAFSNGSLPVGQTGGPCVMQDDTIMNKVPADCRQCILEGFRAAIAKGPLCDEPIRGVRFTITHVEGFTAQSKLTDVIDAARKCCHAAFLAANPRLMEPVVSYDILSDVYSLDSVKALLEGRRGNSQEKRHPGTPLVMIKALVPLIDTFGLEVEIRTKTQGKAFPLAVFDHWSIVPGDPYDTGVKLAALQPAQGFELARDFTSKTRQKKGLPPALP